MKNILAICVLVSLFCGCDNSLLPPEKLNPPSLTNSPLRFQTLTMEKNYVGYDNYNNLIVYKDNLTGAEYLLVDSYRGVTIVKLEKVKGE